MNISQIEYKKISNALQSTLINDLINIVSEYTILPWFKCITINHDKNEIYINYFRTMPHKVNYYLFRELENEYYPYESTYEKHTGPIDSRIKSCIWTTINNTLCKFGERDCFDELIKQAEESRKYNTISDHFMCKEACLRFIKGHLKKFTDYSQYHNDCEYDETMYV